MGRERPPEGDEKTEAGVDCLRENDDSKCTVDGIDKIAEKFVSTQQRAQETVQKGRGAADTVTEGRDSAYEQSDSNFDLSDLVKPFESVLSGTSGLYKDAFDGTILQGQEEVAAALTFGVGGGVLATAVLLLLARLLVRKRGGYIRVRGLIPQIGL